MLNDNGRCYAPTVSRLTIAGNTTNRSRDGEFGDPAAFFHALGLEYVGPLDGHDIGALEPALREAATRDKPVVVHVLTRKGEGYLPAEIRRGEAPPRRRRVRSRDRRSGRSEWIVLHRRVRERADRAGRRPSRDRGDHGGDAGFHRAAALHGALPRPLLRRGDRRAARGDRGRGHGHPRVAAVRRRVFDLPQPRLGPDPLRRRLHALPVVFCIDRAGITGDDGASHHGLYDLALLTKVPGLTLFAPSSYEEVAVMLDDAFRITSGPVALRWPKTVARHVRSDEIGRRSQRPPGAGGHRRVHPRRREDGRRRRRGGRAARRARRARHRLGCADGAARSQDAG